MLQQQRLSAGLRHTLCASHAKLPHKQYAMDVPETQGQATEGRRTGHGPGRNLAGTQCRRWTALLYIPSWCRSPFTWNPCVCPVDCVACSKLWTPELAEVGFAMHRDSWDERSSECPNSEGYSNAVLGSECGPRFFGNVQWRIMLSIQSARAC